MSSLPNVSDLVSGTTTEAEFQAALSQLYDHIAESFNADTPEQLEISNGIITPSKGHVIIDTEELESNDFLNQIVSSDIGNRILLVQNLTSARTVTIRNNQSGSGKIITLSGSDVLLSDPKQIIVLRYNVDAAAWQELWNNFSLYLPVDSLKSAIRQSMGITDAMLQSEFETGDIRPSFRSTPKSGWVFVQGQVLGNIGSGATSAGPVYEALYKFYWNNLNNTYAPVSLTGTPTTRGVSADADWTDGKTIKIPDSRNRSLIGVGDNWELGQAKGSDQVTVELENLPAESLTISGSTSSAGHHEHYMFANTTGSAWYEPLANSWEFVSYRSSNSGNENAHFARSTSTPSLGRTNSTGSHAHAFSGTTAPLGDGNPISITPMGLGINWEQKL